MTDASDLKSTADPGADQAPRPMRIGGMARSVIRGAWAAVDGKQRKRSELETIIREHPMLPAGEATLAVTLAKDGLERSEAEREELLDRHSYADSKPSFNLTDLGNAERLKLWHGDDLRFVPEWKSWIYWTGKRWQRDRDGEIRRKAKLSVRQLYRDAGDIEDDAERKELAKYALKCESAQRIRAMIELAESELAARPEDFDADQWLFNAANGCIDLRTGKLREHRREDMLLKASPVTFRDDLFADKCELWLKFLDRIMRGDAEMIGALQRAVGYSLTGSVREQVLFLCYGGGANGKSTFTETVKAMLGEYATSAAFSTFEAERGGGQADRPRSDLARLAGARFVSASEGEASARLSESWVKMMTGADTVTVRRLHEEPFEYQPTFKLWLASNHKPEVRGTDLAIWRRIKLIPFDVVIPSEEQDRDLGLKLREELPGILAWAVKGCLDWQEQGLALPEKVAEATAEYREEMDVLGDWLSERAEFQVDASEAAADLFKDYASWTEDQGGRAISQRAFAERLKERELFSEKVGGRRRWFGLRLRGGA